MHKSTRHASILERLARDGETSIRDLAAALGVSDMTVRRDLDLLTEQGRVSRTHGGAILSRVGRLDFVIYRRTTEQFAEKRAIARDAARLVEPGMAVSLDTGSTTLEVARELVAIADLTVLTSSLLIAAELCGRPNIQLVLLGGTVRGNSPDLLGPITEENLKRFRVHLAFLGADALNPDGAFTTDVGIARIAQAMIHNAERAVLVADHTKLLRTAFVRYAALSEFDAIITDSAAPIDTQGWLQTAARRVLFAPVRDFNMLGDDNAPSP